MVLVFAFMHLYSILKIFLLLFLSIPFDRLEGLMIVACPRLTSFFNRGSVERTISLNILCSMFLHGCFVCV